MHRPTHTPGSQVHNLFDPQQHRAADIRAMDPRAASAPHPTSWPLVAERLRINSRATWNERSEALRSLIVASRACGPRRTDLSAFAGTLRPLAAGLAECIEQPRSTLVKDVCAALEEISPVLGPHLVDAVGDALLPVLVRRTAIRKQVVRASVVPAATAMLRHGGAAVSPRAAVSLARAVANPKEPAPVRATAAILVGVLLTGSPAHTLAKMGVELAAAIREGCVDASDDVRVHSRANFRALERFSKQHADRIAVTLPPKVIALLQEKEDAEHAPVRWGARPPPAMSGASAPVNQHARPRPRESIMPSARRRESREPGAKATKSSRPAARASFMPPATGTESLLREMREHKPARPPQTSAAPARPTGRQRAMSMMPQRVVSKAVPPSQPFSVKTGPPQVALTSRAAQPAATLPSRSDLFAASSSTALAQRGENRKKLGAPRRSMMPGAVPVMRAFGIAPSTSKESMEAGPLSTQSADVPTTSWKEPLNLGLASSRSDDGPASSWKKSMEMGPLSSLSSTLPVIPEKELSMEMETAFSPSADLPANPEELLAASPTADTSAVLDKEWPAFSPSSDTFVIPQKELMEAMPSTSPSSISPATSEKVSMEMKSLSSPPTHTLVISGKGLMESVQAYSPSVNVPASFEKESTEIRPLSTPSSDIHASPLKKAKKTVTTSILFAGDEKPPSSPLRAPNLPIIAKEGKMESSADGEDYKMESSADNKDDGANVVEVKNVGSESKTVNLAAAQGFSNTPTSSSKSFCLTTVKNELSGFFRKYNLSSEASPTVSSPSSVPSPTVLQPLVDNGNIKESSQGTLSGINTASNDVKVPSVLQPLEDNGNLKESRKVTFSGMKTASDNGKVPPLDENVDITQVLNSTAQEFHTPKKATSRADKARISFLLGDSVTPHPPKKQPASPCQSDTDSDPNGVETSRAATMPPIFEPSILSPSGVLGKDMNILQSNPSVQEPSIPSKPPAAPVSEKTSPKKKASPPRVRKAKKMRAPLALAPAIKRRHTPPKVRRPLSSVNKENSVPSLVARPLYGSRGVRRFGRDVGGNAASSANIGARRPTGSKPKLEGLGLLVAAVKRAEASRGLEWQQRVAATKAFMTACEQLKGATLGPRLAERVCEVLASLVLDVHVRTVTHALDAAFFVLLHTGASRALFGAFERRPALLRAVLARLSDKREAARIAAARVMDSFGVQFAAEQQITLLLRSHERGSLRLAATSAHVTDALKHAKEARLVGRTLERVVEMVGEGAAHRAADVRKKAAELAEQVRKSADMEHIEEACVKRKVRSTVFS